MNELVLNVARKLNDRLSLVREGLAQQVGSVVARRAAEQSLQQGATVIEVAGLCETALTKAADEITAELVWAINHALYPWESFVRELEQMARGFIEQIGHGANEQMQKAERLSKCPPHRLGLHLQSVKERAISSIEVAVQRGRMERTRSLLLKSLGVLVSAPIAGYLIKFLISYCMK